MMKSLLREIIMESVSFLLKILALIIPKRKNLVLFGAFNGNRFGDNPAVLFKYMLQQHPDLDLVWLTNSSKTISEVEKIGGKALKRRAIKGIWLTLTTRVYVTSHSVKDVLMFIPSRKTPKMLYLHHGIPLRKGWLSIADAPKKSIRSSLNKINCSAHMIAPSVFAAEQQNKLLPIGLEYFEISGLPRNDIYFDPAFEIDKTKNSFGLEKFEKIILYAPTWRPWGPTQFFPFPDYDLEELHRFLKEKNMVIVLRPHHIDLKHKKNEAFWDAIARLEHFQLITHNICPDVNILCKISDALITDYSSLYYDYLLANRPVIFLDYDLDRYESEIGFYPDYRAITIGAKPKSQDLFIESLKDISEKKDAYKEKRTQLREKFYKNPDGNSCERVSQLIKKML